MPKRGFVMNNIWKNLEKYERILILGFGKEGQSTYSFIRKNDPSREITIADVNDKVRESQICNGDDNIKFITGIDYLEKINDYDCIIKAPGISLSIEMIKSLGDKLTSQASLFLKEYRDQTIGITGTKGKSTTASFIQHFLKLTGKDTMLIGNIGVPPWDEESRIMKDTVIIYELSSHMLQTISVSPHIALLLNIFPEHLDYYGDMENYVKAKARIFTHQFSHDILITGDDVGVTDALVKFKHRSHLIKWDSASTDEYLFVPEMFASVPSAIRGEHIHHNFIFGAVAACYAGADPALLLLALDTFKSLPHRLEVLGTWKGISFINDSISTIPEATIAALAAFPETNIVIVGGMDRGISYENLVSKLIYTPELFVFCIDESGKKVYDALTDAREDRKHFRYFPSLESAVENCFPTLAGRGGTVLLSPAAASYTQFKNFEARGEAFLEYIKKYAI
jgi:UDP-N-acetylmuramoylalanine--D-glutamate ligase